MKNEKELKSAILRVNHKSYPAYKDLKGCWDFGSYLLDIRHVQSDPYASPSDVRITVLDPGYPADYYGRKPERIALQDQLLRFFHEGIRKYGSGKGGKKNGSISASRPSQKVLERSACHVSEEDGTLQMNIHIAFPAAGRKILGHELIRILFDELPKIVENCLIYQKMSDQKRDSLRQSYELAVDQQAIRDELKKRNLLAFIENGALLPRSAGNKDLPMKDALLFQSPESMETVMDLPFRKQVSGMGIPEGVILITGGGYHGKSTLLNALQEGIYNHTAGDGRELAITREDAAKIRAEDGRCVHQEDISMFIQNLPNKKDTRLFVSEDASGSTSQAANVAEAVESGSRLLLIDEDTSATNFMVRDDLMASVISADQEPIIPFIARIRPLYEQKGVSTILVAGSSGAFFEKADAMLQMDEYRVYDITDKAKNALKNHPDFHSCPDRAIEESDIVRIPLKNRNLDQDRIKVKTSGLDTVSVAREPVDVRYMEQLTDPEQLHTLGKMAVYAGRNLVDGRKSLEETAADMLDIVDRDGYAVLGRGDFTQVRKQDLMGMLSRWRSQQYLQEKKK